MPRNPAKNPCQLFRRKAKATKKVITTRVHQGRNNCAIPPNTMISIIEKRNFILNFILFVTIKVGYIVFSDGNIYNFTWIDKILCIILFLLITSNRFIAYFFHYPLPKQHQMMSKNLFKFTNKTKHEYYN